MDTDTDTDTDTDANSQIYAHKYTDCKTAEEKQKRSRGCGADNRMVHDTRKVAGRHVRHAVHDRIAR